MLVLDEAQVRHHLPMRDAIDSVQEALIEHGRGRVQTTARSRVRAGPSTLNVMSAAFPNHGLLGVKAYTTQPLGPEAYYLLFGRGGHLLCLMEADELGRIRTGATTGVATRHMARPGARRALVVGAGFQAETQVQALAALEGVDSIEVWSRTTSSAQALVGRLQPTVRPALAVVDDLPAAVGGAEIITLVTSSPEPVVMADWLRPGVHINAVGSNRSEEAELDERAVAAARAVVVDSKDQAKMESGELVRAARKGLFSWDDAIELAALLAGRATFQREEDDITVFKSNGLALEDLAVARTVLSRATRALRADAEGAGERA